MKNLYNNNFSPKENCIEHLKHISNQNSIVHYDERSFTISELLDEVKNDTEFGKRYTAQYLKALQYLNDDIHS